LRYNRRMCGRYRLSRADKCIAEHFDIADEVEWSPRYNIAPAQRVAVVRQNPERPVHQFSLMRWGLIPSWAKDASNGCNRLCGEPGGGIRALP
jgi:putative SOS response-associated peptidase YedK